MKTKFEIGQEVWRINYQKVEKSLITGIFVSKENVVFYSLSVYEAKIHLFSNPVFSPENIFFASKEELIKSL